jgi:predicted TIM-barrel fold metal-dependent hydrolase
MITLVDVEAAVAELSRVLDLDARIVCIKGGPAHSPTGLVSPADGRFDPFWGLVNESGVTVGIHSGDAGCGRYINEWEPYGALEAFRHSPLRSVISSDRPPFETLAALVCQGLFDRFPNLRVATIESGRNGSRRSSRSPPRPMGRCPLPFAPTRWRHSGSTYGWPPSTRTT